MYLLFWICFLSLVLFQITQLFCVHMHRLGVERNDQKCSATWLSPTHSCLMFPVEFYDVRELHYASSALIFLLKWNITGLQCCTQPLYCWAFLFLLCSSFICSDLASSLEEKFFSGPGRHHHSGSCHLALMVLSLCPAGNWMTYAVTFLLPPAGSGKKGRKAGTGFTFSG